VSAAGSLPASARSQGACLHGKEPAALCAHASRETGGRAGGADRLQARLGRWPRTSSGSPPCTHTPPPGPSHALRKPQTVTPLPDSQVGPRRSPARRVGRGGNGGEAGHDFSKVLTFSALNRQGEGVQDHKRVVLQLALQNAHHLDLSPGARVHGHLEERER